MSKQTALQKAIQSVEERMTFTHNENRLGELNAVHIILKTLLPYEREVIEHSHIMGQKLIIDCIVQSLPNFSFTTTVNEVQKGLIEGDIKATNYFTKTFDNGND